ncbi:MAG: MFS transporter [Chlamydiia bacterium]
MRLPDNESILSAEDPPLASSIDISVPPLAVEENSSSGRPSTLALALSVAIVSIGYLVDVYDLWLFALYRPEILLSIGIEAQDQLSAGLSIFNWQMCGLLAGGFLFGWLGDRYGRRTGLLLSIGTYGIATLLTASATSLTSFAALRFVSCLGIAGELGLGAALVQELLPARHRWTGSLSLVFIGLSGALIACFCHEYFSWTSAFILGGGAGILLLFMRRLIIDSSKQPPSPIPSLLFTFLVHKAVRRRLLAFVLIGLPLISLFSLVTGFTPELSAALGLSPVISSAEVLIPMQLAYVGGDALASGLSHLVGSRKRIISLFLCISAGGLFGLCLDSVPTTTSFLVWSALLGLGSGFWILFLTSCIESFGQNLRGRAASVLPNLVRASPLCIFLAFGWLTPFLGIPYSILVLGSVTLLGAAWGLNSIDECFGRSLDFEEPNL